MLILSIILSPAARAERYEAIDLGLIGEAINDAGQICGALFSTESGERAFLYDRGHVTDLGALGGSMSHANAISANGHVVGAAEVRKRSEIFHAFLFDGTRMRDLGTLGGRNSSAFAINTSGQIVGRSETSNGRNKEDAFIYEHGKMTDLNALLKAPLPNHIRLWRAIAINSPGQILVEGQEVTRTKVTIHGYVLTPR